MYLFVCLVCWFLFYTHLIFFLLYIYVTVYLFVFVCVLVVIRVLFFFFLNRLTGFYFIRYVLHAVYLLMDFIFNYSFSLFVAMANSCSVSSFQFISIEIYKPNARLHFSANLCTLLFLSNQKRKYTFIYLFIYIKILSSIPP